MDEKRFNEAMELLHSGEIPANMPDVAAYVRGTIKELMMYAEAVTECCFRLNNSNKLLRQLAGERTGLKGNDNGRGTQC